MREAGYTRRQIADELGLEVKQIGEFALLLGVVIGIAGMALVAAAYPIHNRVLKKEREKIAPEILRLSDELIQ